MGWFLRRPLRLFAAIVVIGAVGIGVAMTALGGTSTPLYSATPLTSAQFAQLNQNACTSALRQLKAATARKPKNFTHAAESVARISSTLNALNLNLDGRVPPPSEVASFKSFLGRLQVAVRAVNHLNRLTGAEQWRSAALLVRSLGWRDALKQLGSSARPGHLRCDGARSPAAILTAVAAGTSAASSYFAKPLTRAQFIRTIERGCESVRGGLEAVTAERPANLEEAAQKVHALTVLLDGYLQRLRGLTPPPSVAVGFQRVLRLGERVDRAMHSLDQLGTLGEWRRAIRLVNSRWWTELGEQLGRTPDSAADIQCG
jgi:hypothetical protein